MAHLAVWYDFAVVLRYGTHLLCCGMVCFPGHVTVGYTFVVVVLRYGLFLPWSCCGTVFSGRNHAAV